MSRTPSMTPAEAEAALAAIGCARNHSIFVNTSNRALVKKWLAAMGVPSAYVATLSNAGLACAYNDRSNGFIATLKKQATDKGKTGPAIGDPDLPEDDDSADDIVAPASFPVATKAMPLPTPIVVQKRPAIQFDASSVNTSDEMSWDQLIGHLFSTGVIPHVVNRVLLYGPPRTGKSTSSYLMGKSVFGNAERLTFHRQQPVDDLLGGYCLRDGTTVWSDGPAVRALRHGVLLIIDEVDQFSAETRFTCHAIMDDPAAVTLASGERVEAAPGYCVIGTTNAQPGTLPLTILDRFDMILHCGTLSSGMKTKLGKLADAAQRSVSTSVSMWTRPASPNLLLAAAKLTTAGISSEHVARILYPNQVTEQSDLLTLLAMS